MCLSVCHFVLVFFSPFGIPIASLGEERANLRAFRTFVRFVLVWVCRFPLPLGVWEGLRFVIVALPGLFSYLFLVLFARCSICAVWFCLSASSWCLGFIFGLSVFGSNFSALYSIPCWLCSAILTFILRHTEAYM